MPNNTPVVLHDEQSFRILARAIQEQNREMASLKRKLENALHRHQTVYTVPLSMHRGITDEAATKHSSTTYTVSRYNPGTTVDSGTNDEVIFELIDVGSGKVVHYFKSGDKFYMTSVECPNS